MSFAVTTSKIAQCFNQWSKQRQRYEAKSNIQDCLKFRSIHCKYHFVNIFRKRNTIFSTFTLLSKNKKYWSFSWKYCLLAWLLKKRHQILSLFLSSKKYTLSSAWMFYWDCLTHVGSVKQGAKKNQKNWSGNVIDWD